MFFMYSGGIEMTCGINDTHKEKLNSVAEFIKVKFWLFLIFLICLHNQLKFHNYIAL